MKKFRALTTGILCAASLAVGASAADVIEKIEAQLRPDFEIVYEGEKQNFKNVAGEKVYPILYEGSTYLPIRAVSEMINKEVTWYEADKRIEISDKQEITVTDADKIVTEDTSKNDKPAKQDKEKPEKEKPEKKPQNKYDDDDNIAVEINISKEEAKKIALEKAGVEESEAENFKIELDDGAYEVEFRSGAYEYEGKINPESGEVYDWEIDD